MVTDHQSVYTVNNGIQEWTALMFPDASGYCLVFVNCFLNAFLSMEIQLKLFPTFTPSLYVVHFFLNCGCSPEFSPN